MWVQDADQSCCTNGLSQHAHRTMVAHQFLMVIYPSSAPLPRAFDVELLYIARYFNIPIAEVAVNWEEIEGNFCLQSMQLFLLFLGSKLTPLWSGLQMGRDLLFLRLRYMFGLWKIKTKFS